MSPYQYQYPHIRIWIKMEQSKKRWGYAYSGKSGDKHIFTGIFSPL